MLNDDPNQPPVEGRAIRWILWYRRTTGAPWGEAAREHSYYLRIRQARATHYHCTESRKPHNPARAILDVDAFTMATVGVAYIGIWNNMKKGVNKK